MNISTNSIQTASSLTSFSHSVSVTATTSACTTASSTRSASASASATHASAAADRPLFAVARTHYALMDSRRNAIAGFVVHFGHDVLVIIRGVLQILLSRHVDEVAHNEALDRLVLGHGTSRDITSDKAHSAAVVPVLAAVLSLLGHGRFRGSVF